MLQSYLIRHPGLQVPLTTLREHSNIRGTRRALGNMGTWRALGHAET